MLKYLSPNDTLPWKGRYNMLQNIDMNQLTQLKKRDPEFAEMIDDLLLNHKRVISTISHELRNPLALISSSLQLLSSRFPEVKDFKYWDTTLVEIEYMKCLLQEISAFNSTGHLKQMCIDMHEFSEHLAETFTFTTRDTDIKFIANIPDLLPFVLGDHTKIHEVFVNILENAVDAVGTYGTITYSAYQEMIDEKPYFVAAITDDGCGIPEEYIESIFELFKTYKNGGTGLGLAISRNIIEAHKGSITVESTVEKGTTFLIRLPIHYH